MKGNSKFLPFLSATLLGTALPLGSIFCLTTAFGVTAYSPLLLAALCLGLAAFTALLSITRFRGNYVILVLGLLGAVCMWVYTPTGTAMAALSQHITQCYSSAYGTPVFPSREFLPEELAQLSMNWALFFLAIPGCILTTLSVSRRWNCIGAVAVSLLPVATCVVVTNTVPDSWALYLLLSSLMLLLLTQAVRRRSQYAGSRLVALLLIPCLLCPWLLLTAVPQEGYQIPTNSLYQSAVSWLKEHFSLQGQQEDDPIELPDFNSTIDLTKAGPRKQVHTPILQAKAPFTGPLYLRGQSYDTYTGTGWKQQYTGAEERGWADQGLISRGTLEISARTDFPLRFFPYYTNADILGGSYANGHMSNDARQINYQIHMLAPTEKLSISLENRLNYDRWSSSFYPSPQDDLTRYLYLPDRTLSWAALVLDQIPRRDLGEIHYGPFVTLWDPQAIADYVSTLVPYDLNTHAMPEGAQDFAQWFAQRADSGYCVHYATLATVLLRTAGIPARYVTGYLVYSQEGERTQVTSDNAHAWVEYYDNARGWQLLEVTPDAGLPRDPNAELPPVTTAPSTTPSTTVPPVSQTTRPGTTGAAPSQSTATVPVVTTPETPAQTRALGWLFTLLKVLGILAGIFLTAFGQYLLRRRLRWRKCSTGPVNAQALARWREVLGLCRLLKKNPPEALLQLAEKAKFSQHTLDKTELQKFDFWISQNRQALGPRHLLLRLIFAL